MPRWVFRCPLLQLTIAGRSCLVLFSLAHGAQAQSSAEIVTAPPSSAISQGDETSLQELLVYADKHAPALATASARVGIASAEVIAASPWFPENPEVGGSIGSRSSAGNSALEYEISIAQKLEVAGERGLRKMGAQAGERVAALSREEVRWGLHVEVHRLHNELLLMSERRQQAERFVTFSESLQNIASRQVKAGETSPLTLLVADADLAQTKSVLIEVRRQESASRTALAGIIGWPMNRSLKVAGVLPPTTRAPDTAILLRLMAKHHPSLQTRREAITASQARLKFERRSLWPKPTIGATYTREPGLAGQPNNDIWLFNVSVPVPLWQRNQGGIAKAEAQLEVAASEEAEVTALLESKLQMTANALNSAAAQVELYQKSVIPKLEKNLGSLQRAYELGEVDLLQVSQTRERLLDGSKQYLDARVSYFRAAAALEGYVGSEIANLSKDMK